MTLVVKHKSNAMTHVRNSSNSLKSRKITGPQRGNLKRTLVDCPFPSREYHKKLSQADTCCFNSDNLGEIGNSKNVYKQIKHEGLKAKQKHDNIFIRIMNLKEEYLSQFDYSKIKSFIQYFSMQPFVNDLWTEKDIDIVTKKICPYSRVPNNRRGIGIIGGELDGVEKIVKTVS